ncbi:putative fAD linked oxidase domain-containing protein [Mycobacteroides abscessus subsp. bolletii 1513]|uniref:Putative fAD linked oxidase domain-containing protein n=1 Tax=Mycobacteroides abscessus subsp. bolletii 1513 TaxID=1299321 RepID=X8DY47_9MYCO|nr:putative fAD linked oxidase domain-containing protein [Mycobacteroides abscessus subsp. bolletii 1513]
MAFQVDQPMTAESSSTYVSSTKSPSSIQKLGECASGREPHGAMWQRLWLLTVWA